MTALSSEPYTLYPIREVARLTGINPVTLRAWERRYGLIQPQRTESGHRLYSMTDIETVRQVQTWIERGVPVSRVTDLLARAAPSSQAFSAHASNEWGQWQVRLRSALGDFNEVELERLYGQVFSGYSTDLVFEQILLPLWRQLLACRNEFGRTSEWLLLDGFLRARLQQRLQLQAEGLRPSVLILALAGHCRELELLSAGVLLASHEVAVRVLSIDQPWSEMTLVCEKVQPQALIVFANRPLATADHPRLERLAQGVNCPVLLAGDAADLARDALAGSAIGCLGSQARVMSERLRAYLNGTLDS